MANVTTRSDLERPAHTTNGSSRRAARSVSAQGLIYRLGVEIQSLKGDLRHTSGGRAAKTLAKANNLRVALITLRSGFTIDPHAIAGGATLQVLEGRLRIHPDDIVHEIVGSRRPGGAKSESPPTGGGIGGHHGSRRRGVAG